MDFLASSVFKIFAVALLACTLQAQQPAKPQTAAKPDLGAITDGVYRNSAFGFTYKPVFGWVDRTREMRDDSDDSSADSSAAKKSILLLAVFERPPESSGDSVNSAVRSTQPKTGL